MCDPVRLVAGLEMGLGRWWSRCRSSELVWCRCLVVEWSMVESLLGLLCEAGTLLGLPWGALLGLPRVQLALEL